MRLGPSGPWVPADGRSAPSTHLPCPSFPAGQPGWMKEKKSFQQLKLEGGQSS